jgi:hypothetical protein
VYGNISVDKDIQALESGPIRKFDRLTHLDLPDRANGVHCSDQFHQFAFFLHRIDDTPYKEVLSLRNDLKIDLWPDAKPLWPAHCDAVAGFECAGVDGRVHIA